MGKFCDSGFRLTERLALFALRSAQKALPVGILECTGASSVLFALWSDYRLTTWPIRTPDSKLQIKRKPFVHSIDIESVFVFNFSALIYRLSVTA